MLESVAVAKKDQEQDIKGGHEPEEDERELNKLEEEVVKVGGTERSSKEAKTAVAYCRLCISEYETLFESNEESWFKWQWVTICAGVIATLAGVISVPIPSDWGRWADVLNSFYWVRGIPAAVATIAASVLAAFHYREDAVRCEVAANILWSELAKFNARAEPYNKGEKKDISAFLNNVCRLVEADIRSWSAQMKAGHQGTRRQV
jgi:hypothetical protein